MRQSIRKIKRLLLFFIRIFFQVKGLHFYFWDEWAVGGFSDLAEVIQYKMVRGSGASSSTPFPRWDIDINLPPREEVEVPVEEAPEPALELFFGEN